MHRSPIMRLAGHLTALRALCKQSMSVWSVKTRHAPSRHCRDARVYGHMPTAMHEIEYIPPIEYTPHPPPPSPLRFGYCLECDKGFWHVGAKVENAKLNCCETLVRATCRGNTCTATVIRLFALEGGSANPLTSTSITSIRVYPRDFKSTTSRRGT